MDLLRACSEGDLAQAAACLRQSGHISVPHLLRHAHELHLDVNDTKQAHECRHRALTQPWPSPLCPGYSNSKSGLDPACVSGKRVDPAVILMTIQLMNTRTFEGLSLATKLLFHAVKLKGKLTLKAQVGLCEIAATDTKELRVHPWLLTEAFDNEPAHFTLPNTQLLTVSHFWLAWAHEWGHVTRCSTEEGADSYAADMLLSAACLVGDYQSLMQLLHTKLRIGDYPLDRVDELGNSPLCVAAEQGHTLIVALLLENGATAGFRNGADQTPLELARRNGHRAVETLLLSA